MQKLKKLKDNSNKGIYSLILAFIAVKVFFITTRYHLPIWDEGVYMGMGKYIYSLGSSGLWEIIRPIGLPLVSGAIWLAGLNQVYFTQAAAVLFAAASIFMTYLIGKRLFGGQAGIIAAFLLAISPVFFLYSIYVLTEISSTFFALLAVYMYIQGRYASAED